MKEKSTKSAHEFKWNVMFNLIFSGIEKESLDII